MPIAVNSWRRDVLGVSMMMFPGLKKTSSLKNIAAQLDFAAARRICVGLPSGRARWRAIHHRMRSS
jgi:hypothetical protein